jgi:uncharacterized protein (DUF2225 family)
MFSEFIQAKVEEQFGKIIESNEDCSQLAIRIFEDANYKISTETLAGLFGINTKRKEPVLFITEVISNYLGYKSSVHMRGEYNHLKFEQLNPSLRKDYTCTCVFT